MTRRSFLKNSFWLVLLSIGAYPLYEFVVSKRIHPPKKVRIHKHLLPGQYIGYPKFYLFETQNGPIAVSRRCTHLGCTVNYEPTLKMFICPCHQSRFMWNGKYISGPANGKNLARFQVKVLKNNEGYVVLVPRGA